MSKLQRFLNAVKCGVVCAIAFWGTSKNAKVGDTVNVSYTADIKGRKYFK